ncbi:MAG TPA: FAD-dependent oxidoreductase [Methylomusa anaerophila]|uniref:Glutamate synthase [NADPH] small chain n=1 Tax=Methylomusa anaerophila TaxID=1930071 RepID=A0A348AFH8_9FIRM|nr:molybdopterin-dependent oxidoreductase [Methylomusa anaerophila]BBB89826.1 glutamate synthase [NADPH] small chain [Methylomusa anaerophila]HML89127.1 FAD-dependent oxidoreductase [Methylomusa anaerophila]
MSKISINVNGREIVALDGQTILQAASENGIEIPHLCYDERIKPYGACGLCVVEMEGSPKLVRSCATFAQNGQVIKTNTSRTVNARKTALKLLAVDHRGDCRPPCHQACPAHTDCQGYVGLIANGQYREALKLIKEKMPIPFSIGKICPHPCEEACRRELVEEPISIAALKAFVAELDLKGEPYLPPMKKPSGKKVAIVGAGPAGLTAGYFLARDGHKIVIYEAMPYPGGMLRYGIPQYRLDKAMIDAEVALMEKMGIEFVYNTKIGDDVSLDHLRNSCDAVFLGIGSWESQGLRCKGDDMEGVLGGIDFLREVTRNGNVALGGKVLVVGGGNTAMDVARTSVRLGADQVTVVYRRTLEEMPAERLEIDEAMEEGVKFQFLVAPLEVLGENGRANALKCQVMQLGEADASGRRKPEPTGETVTFAADRIIAAIGQKTVIGNINGIATDKAGNIVVKEGAFTTSLDKVFAGGDAVTGPKIAIDAVAQGKNAATVIDGYLNGNLAPYAEERVIIQKDLTAAAFADKEKVPRVALRVADEHVRNKNFMQVAEVFTEEDALRESKRCLECGCRDYFECRLLKYIQEYDIDTEKPAGIESPKRQVIDNHPFVERNADKCILCGLCVRVCDEVVGATAIGLVGRGFDSVIYPEFKLPLSETSCIACGSCVDVCPTGACMEKQAAAKQVPASLNNVSSVCGYCGVGCRVNVEYRGDVAFRITPDKTQGDGWLCQRGKFGLDYVNDSSRLTQPVIKRHGQFVQADWNEANLEVVKGLQAIAAIHGKDSIGVVVSPRLTNEELFLAGKLADAVQTTVKTSYTVNGGSGLDEVFGYDASTNSYAELDNSDFVLTVGDVKGNHPVLDFKIRVAELANAEWPQSLTSTADVKAFVKALLDLGVTDEKKVAAKAEGFAELKASLAAVQVSDAAKSLAQRYSKAAKPFILIDEDTVSKEAVKLFAFAAVLAGKVGAAYRGVILARSKNNSQGAIDMGFVLPADAVAQGIDSGKIKALVIIGENPAVCPDKLALLKRLSFLAVYDIFLTETAAAADVAVPLVSAVESEGTYTRSDRRIQAAHAALQPKTGKDNLQVLLDTLGYFGVKYNNIADVRAAIAKEVPTYAGIGAADFDAAAVYWPNTKQNVSGTNVLYTESFATANQKAVLGAVGDGPAIAVKKKYDTVELYSENKLKVPVAAN